MNCHQILSGACNAGDKSFAVGSVEGIPFTAYAAGCNVVILASTFERVQIIPGAWHNYIRISCLDCSTDTGKIAAAYNSQVCIFEPTPLIHNNSSHHLDYRWVQTGSIHAEGPITSLSWNLEGTRLLTGGTVLQLWHLHLGFQSEEETDNVGQGGGVTFEIGGEGGHSPGVSAGPIPNSGEGDERGWECIWKCRTATPVMHMAFSQDGTLFATAGNADRLVKIWFENKPLLFPSKSMDHATSINGNVNDVHYGFVYIAHPRAVTYLSWRKTSKYMPKGSVSNMLVTSCRDNICRVWVETVLPDDGLVNMNQFDPLATQNPKFRTHRHKHRFMQRLKHMKTCFHIRRHAKGQPAGADSHMGVIANAAGLGGGVAGLVGAGSPIPTLPSTYSVHDFHSYGYHGTGVTPGLHFHLSASINAETDIPLVPSLMTGEPDREPNFIIHWLNNKEMHFSLQAENILHELTRRVVEKEEGVGEFAGDIHNESEHDETSTKKRHAKVAKGISHDESTDEHHSFPSSSGHSHQSLSATTSINSLGTDSGGPTGGAAGTVGAGNQIPDSLDAKIDCLLRDWHHSPDLLFSVHPIDGSYLIWVVEWLDEYHPGSFRQAQVSFSTRIPNAFPLGDAMTMATSVCLYNAYGCHLNYRDVFRPPAHSKGPVTAPTDNLEPPTPLPSLIEEEGETPATNTEEPPLSSTTFPNNEARKTSAGDPNNQTTETGPPGISADPSPTISMVTKHSNGTLNLWQLTFADRSKFSQVLSIGHSSRVSGHRFRVNDITCHPVLPLLLTTSHHNISEFQKGGKSQYVDGDLSEPRTAHTDFCSELILWRVDAVGPLSKSGGVAELARISSPEISAFSNVAWIPTLLPSTTLGNLSNSPSACFVASDGKSLRVYQAVIDARTLLAEISSSERRSRILDSMLSLSTEESSSCDEATRHGLTLHDKIKIVSQQSTARPGCIIQLDAIADATHDWQNTQFLHVFQEQLITGERAEDTNRNKSNAYASTSMNAPDLGFMENHMAAMVDLHNTVEFEEPFYIVVLERTNRCTVVHMWRLVIASQSDVSAEMTGSMLYVPDSQLVQDDEDGDGGGGGRSASNAGENAVIFPEAQRITTHFPTSHVHIETTKVSTHDLPLPDGVELVHAAPAAGHLSSASIYPACFAPYIITTACSDSTIRFWKCKVSRPVDKRHYSWAEWDMNKRIKDSLIDISGTGQPLNICAAYSGRIACAYKYGKSFTRPSKNDPDSRYINLCVAIYECESTGGSEWVLEDTIHLKNIQLPRMQVDPFLDLSYLYDNRFLQKKQRLNHLLQTFSSEDVRSKNGEGSTFDPHSTHNYKTGLLAVPSFSTLQSLRKSIIECGNTCPLTQKHLVQLDWVSKEDGSHILTVAVGSKVLLFTPVSSDLAQANMKAMKESQSSNRPILRKASSLAVPQFTDEIRWMKLRKIDLNTADGLPPLPMQISWVRDGILVVGMDSEMHVYSQWKPTSFGEQQQKGTLCHQESDELQDTRNLRDEDLRNLAQETSQRRLANVSSMPHLSRVSSINLTMLDSKKKRGAIGQQEQHSTLDYMPDYGLFEASRIACPVLPQYHPKQLMELLNSGKIRWVKAILAHLVRCISSTYAFRQGSGLQSSTDEETLVRQRGWSRSRTLSVSYAGAGTTSPLEHRGSTTAIPEEVTLDYAEIASIPPLPLYTLLAADRETTSNVATSSGTGPNACSGGSTNKTGAADEDNYGELFDSTLNGQDESLDQLLCDEPDSPRRHERRQSISQERQGLSHFGPRQGRLLSRLLTHTHLPGLSSLDQMHLLALADTVSTCNTDFAERFAIDAAKTAIAKENLTGLPDSEDISTDSLDDCGLRFLLAMKHYNYLLRCLPYAQRGPFQKQGVGTNNLVWAFHSESEEELLALIPSYSKGSPKWATLKELGVGWWLRNHTTLKTCIDKVAKAAYLIQQDPMDAALFYLAMKKKSLVWGLFRSKRDDRMTSFFSNNFSEDRWRKAALKNAFALLGKQRFEHAAAFFLLAGALRDAIEVCLNKLDDFQLAMVIARLYEGELDSTPPNLRRLLYQEILGCNAEGNQQTISKMHPDPFLRSMALWILKEHSASLNTLLHNVGSQHPAYTYEEERTVEVASANPNVFNFYVYLRTHPLLIRQYIASTAQDKRRGHTMVLAGFSYGGDIKSAHMDRQLMLEDSITPLERQLYFTTAHAHFKAGCPALALEVLSKLPGKVMESADGVDSPAVLSSPIKSFRGDSTEIETGILTWEQPRPETPLEKEPEKDKPSGSSATSDSLDWSQPIGPKEEKLVLSWDDNDEDDDDLEDKQPITETIKKETSNQNSIKQDSIDQKRNNSTGILDIMAQQLKFVACLKILMEELSTLATGFEVDGGQLRYQLYVWLEREVDALKQLCNYSFGEPESNTADELLGDSEAAEHSSTPTLMRPGERPTLHEILMAEKLDFEAKVQRAARRKRWLKANETLLRTLLSYCSLHGASGGGLASVRMELVLLLQELQQDKTQQQLLSPLPFPTTLPLLSASVACNKTVVADPVRHLQSHTHDMLETLVALRRPPSPSSTHFSEVVVLRDLAVALSACIYQSLCDSDTFKVKHHNEGFQNVGIESLARLNNLQTSSHLIAGQGRRRRYSSDEPLQVSTHPGKWPGVTNLRALLAREKDEDTPRLNVLLVEAFVSTYMSLLVYALATCDALILYRLAGQRFSQPHTWAVLFGGGVKKLLRVATSNQSQTGSIDKETTSTSSGDGGVWTTVTSLTKQRVRLNMRLLGQLGPQGSGGQIKEDKPTYREQFVPPEMSMLSYFLTKPQLNADASDVDYDSAYSAVSDLDEDEDEEDVFEGSSTGAGGDSRTSAVKLLDLKDNSEHSNPSSFSWCVLRCALIKLVQVHLQDFLAMAGIELQELPVCSPLVHATLRVVSQWQDVLRDELDSRRPPPRDYIPGCYVETNASGPAIHKYRSLLDRSNTPFHPKHASAAPVRRLWSFLVRQEPVQDIFIRAVFGKRPSASNFDHLQSPCDNVKLSDDRSGSDSGTSLPEPVRIIHKEQDSISAFCLNQVSPGLLALATPRELQEIDISLLLELPSWLEDECEFDIMNLTKEPESLPASSFLVIQTAADRPALVHSTSTITNQSSYTNPTTPQPGLGGQTGRGASVVLKHKVDGIRRLSSHPLLPLYLTGSQDGSVHMWEWGHAQPVSVPRPAGTFAKVTRVRYSEHGNKFGVADADGNVSLWQVGLSSANTRPFFTYQCHSKLTSDFVFLSSCSMIATAGHSSESRNVALWDSLLPHKKALITAFNCHEQGAAAVAYAPQHQLLISAGKKGDVCIIDVRQRQIRHRFQAHEAAIKCLALDPAEEFFVTGSADGDIKVWNLSVHNAMYVFPGEHARSSFFKNIGQGVTQLYIDNGARLFSCGADGSMKVRHLPDNDVVVQSYY